MVGRMWVHLQLQMEGSKRDRVALRDEAYCYGDCTDDTPASYEEEENESHSDADEEDIELIRGPLLREEDAGAITSNAQDEDYDDELSSEEREVVQEVHREVHEEGIIIYDAPCRIPTILTQDRTAFDLAIIMIEENESHRVMKRFIDNLRNVQFLSF